MDDFDVKLAEVDSRSRSNTHRIDDLEKRQDNLDELVGTVKVLAVKEEAVESTVKEIKQDVKTLTMKPAKRWDDMTDKVIGLIIAGVVGFMLSRIGM